jgi:hypothetical protein
LKLEKRHPTNKEMNMDPITFATAASLAASAWKLLAPFAQKMAGKLSEKAGEALPEVTGKVWDAVKEKLESHPETKSLPADLSKTPDDPMVQGAFQYQLKKLLENDAAFARQLDGLIKQAGKQSTSISVKVEGDGAAAVGDGAQAVGAGGILIGGNVSGGITMGDQREKKDKK